MTTTQQEFTAGQYGSRAQSYVASAVHSAGADLDQIEAELQGMSAARAIDLGCGGGHVSYRAARHVAEVVACDVTPAMLDAVATAARERGLTNIAVQQAAAEALPFADASFDVALSRFSAHHWQNMEAGLREARRVLKPNGRAIFVDATAPADPLFDMHLQAVELLRDASHVRDYTVAEWTATLARAGFAVEGLTVRVLRMEFSTWIARTRTPQLRADAIRSLQTETPQSVRDHFAIGAEGSFDLQCATFLARPV
jgi:SAM-dependent methyltransferase